MLELDDMGAKKEKGEPKSRFTLLIEDSLLEALDDLRRGEKGLPSRSEMVRALIKQAVEAKAKKKN